MPIFAEVPEYENPVSRFFGGKGELKEMETGRAFTIWEAILHLKIDQYPLNIRGTVFSRHDLLEQAAKLLEEGEVTSARYAIGEYGLDCIYKECIDAGLIHKSH